MKLKKIIKGLSEVNVKGSKEIEIEAVTCNSKLASPGCMFIAKRGEKFDGNDFVNDAILAGAACVVSDFYNPFIENAVQVIVPDVEAAEVILTKEFYLNPANELFMVGITGTNGKTTTSYIVYHLFNTVESMGLIGTIERIVGDYSYPSDLTLPDCNTTLKLLHDMVQCKQGCAVLEVCSHGLAQNRADALTFDVAAFTNLSPEHIDYHKSIEEYFLQKQKLFNKLKPGGVAIINGDDQYAKEIKCDKIVRYGIYSECEYLAKEIQYSDCGTTFELIHPEGMANVFVPYIGQYNVYNTLCAIAIARERGMTMETVVESLKTLVQVPGRMEMVSVGNNKKAYIDFAHTDEALKNALLSLKGITKGKVIAIFGCGGDRDFEKRPRMAKVSQQYADFTIVTSDNPRGEDLEKIVSEITAGFTKAKYECILDRKDAIARGISLMQDGDVLLIAGKGHEKKQIFHGKSIDFDDIAVAKELANCLI